jgi:NADH pyrophosphatase NudC (nudix superfamily)
VTAHGYCFHCGTKLVSRHQEDRERPTCPACGFIHYLDPKVAVAVVLGDDDGVLLGKRCVDPATSIAARSSKRRRCARSWKKSVSSFD